jgi:hypothetical protein
VPARKPEFPPPNFAPLEQTHISLLRRSTLERGTDRSCIQGHFLRLVSAIEAPNIIEFFEMTDRYRQLSVPYGHNESFGRLGRLARREFRETIKLPVIPMNIDVP